MSRIIQAVTVNHNTSIFTELMLRSLYSLHGRDLVFSVTVLDSQSTDDVSGLRSFVHAKGASFCTTELSLKNRYAGNTHGENLRTFVLEHPDCDYYLFLDSDIVFIQPYTVNTMRDELDRNHRLFGIQARISRDGRTEVPGGSWSKGGRQSFLRRVRGDSEDDVKIGTAVGGKAFKFVSAPRIKPMCCLVKNSDTFRSVVELIGLSCAYIECAAGGVNFDTFGLMTQVMRTHRLRHGLSSKIVLHFGGVTGGYGSNNMVKRIRCMEMLCLKMLEDARSENV